MTQSTYFNQVKNVLKVLQGYTKAIRFIALLTMLCTIGVGQMWGADVTYVFKDAADNPGNANDWLTDDIDSYTSWSATKGGNNNPKYYSTGNGLRVYNGGKFTITSSKTLASITLTFSGTGYTFQSTNTTTPQTVTPNAKSYEWSVGRTCRLQKIEITYAAGSSTPTPSLSATPTTIDFGTVEQGATIANKTVAINFANLTGQVNYSGLSNPFTATGTVSNSGDNITIAANTATIGEYSQTLTITSAADSKTAEVIVKMNIVAPFEGKKLVFDFVTHPSGWPAAKANATEGSYVYTLDEVDYTFSHTKSGDGIYLGGTSKTSGYLMLASGNKLGLPAIKGYKLVKVDGTLNGSGTPSTASQVSITNAGGTVISGGAAQTWDTKGGTKTYNLTDTEANTVYYLTVANKNLQMITLALYYEEVAGAVEIPSAPAFTVAGGSYYGTQSIEITCATAGANIYYTLDGSVPTSSSTPYTGAISISETKTLKAIAIKGENSSSITEATYTILAPLTTMDQIFAKATAVGSTATSVEITFDNWVVSAVKGDGKTAFVTDGTKGFVIFDKDENLGFSVGNTLSGTATCKVQLYNGFAELTALTSATTGLNVTTGGTITTQELDAAGIAALTGINTGSLIKINGNCSSTDSKYYVAGVQIYTSLYNFGTLEVDVKYNITGIYQQYHSTKEMLPRSAEDIEEIQEPLTTYNVNWLVNSDEWADSESVKEGTKITSLPEDPTDECGGKTFVGWSNQEVTDGNKPAVLFKDVANSPTIAANTTFHAVFADKEGDGESGWQKVIATDEVVDGGIFALLTYDEVYYLANAQSTSNPSLQTITKQDGKITVTDEMKWRATAVGGGFTFTSYNNANYYLWGAHANDGIRINTESTKQSPTNVWSIELSNDYGVVLYHNASDEGKKYLSTYGNDDWRNYLISNIDEDNRVANLYKEYIGTTYSDYTTSCLDVIWTISEGGTLSTDSGITTTVIPNEGYTYGEPAYTVTSGTATVTQNGNIFTAVPTTDCMIQINMVQKTIYTVTWMVNGKEYTEGTPSTTVYADERVTTLPTPPEPNAYCGDVFVGWTTENPASGNFNEAPTVYNEQSAFPPASANQIFYAVFADYEQQ